MKKTAGSGCGKVEKGDDIDEMYLCDGKSSRVGRITITAQMLDKLWRDGKKMGKIPFFDLDTTLSAMISRPRYFVMIPGPVWQILKDRLTPEEFEMLRPK